LPIDFASLAEQKERELAKLEQMVAYAEGCSCRRASILAYFGEETSACGRCDGCDVSQSGELVLVEPGSGVESAVRRSLEAARDTRGRVGKTTLAAALAGSQSQKTQRLGKNHAWMGALSGVPQKHIVDLLHGLQSAGLVRQEGDSMRPTVTISAAGEEFLRGRSQEGLSLRIGGECVASFGRVGEKSARGVERESTPSREDGVAAKDANWTARVLSAGFSIEECSQIRRLSSGQVLDQVLWLVEQGHEVPAGPLLDTSLTGREEVLRRQILRRLEAREAGLSVEGLGRQKENPGAC
jgi:superfamily II DNA helicase RecQ